VSYSLAIEEEAEQDIEAIVAWMAQYSPEKATLWGFEIQEAIESLQTFPFRCPLARESETFGAAIRHLLFGKYRILFTVIDETVYVLRVRHSAQDVLRPSG
jgi:plasmid stabilization system protein ParE